MALTNKLTAIANAIREKTGSTDEMSLDRMVTEISGITSGSSDSVMKGYLTLRSGDGYQFYKFKGTYESLNEILKYSDTSSVKEMTSMFDSCTNLTTIPQIDTSSATSMYSMFSGCSNLTTIPQIDTSSVKDMHTMFRYCSVLTTIPQIDTSSVTNMQGMFYGCEYRLNTIPQIDTSSAITMKDMFYNCKNLTTIPQIDTRSVTSMSGMFYSCNSLTNCYLRNIKTDLYLSNGTAYGHLLTLESLLYIIKELRNTGSAKTLTIGSANIEKINNTYVKTIAITDEMRSEDDLIDEKLPFEVCESTDEGAMSIYDYCSEKNWQIK